MLSHCVLCDVRSGRFETNKRLCLSMSDFHPETWVRPREIGREGGGRGEGESERVRVRDDRR
eukprot:2746833-Pleurochrysis_carterae.AAC.2